jgi:KUP system potassium uptake protein
MQAIQLGYSRTLRVHYTSARVMGQIYVPAVNWGLTIACIGLVLGFGSSTNLAAAYGVAIATTMLITTDLFYFVARRGTRLALLYNLKHNKVLHQQSSCSP